MLYIEYDENKKVKSPYLEYHLLRQVMSKKGVFLPNENQLTESMLDQYNIGMVDLNYLEGEFEKIIHTPVFKIPVLDAPVFKDGFWHRRIHHMDASPDDIAMVSNRMTTLRDALLTDYIDKISPLRWEDFTEEEKEEIRLFRRKLLDMSDQENFPWIEFPEVPLSLTDKLPFRSYAHKNGLPWREVRAIGPNQLPPPESSFESGAFEYPV